MCCVVAAYSLFDACIIVHVCMCAHMSYVVYPFCARDALARRNQFMPWLLLKHWIPAKLPATNFSYLMSTSMKQGIFAISHKRFRKTFHLNPTKPRITAPRRPVCAQEHSQRRQEVQCRWPVRLRPSHPHPRRRPPVQAQRLCHRPPQTRRRSCPRPLPIPLRPPVCPARIRHGLRTRPPQDGRRWRPQPVLR